MSEIKIIPIFDQSVPGIWDDFLRIRAVAMKTNYNYDLSSDEIARFLSEYRSDYAKKSYNFAFGAYDNTQMIGFIRGYGARSTAQIQCFYVLPQYQGRHIGGQLLKNAERSIAPAYPKVELISLGHAEKFYQHNNYTSIYGANTYSKKLEVPHCYDVPLFGYSARIARKCAHLSPNMDISALVMPHAPIFTHFDVHGDATGLLIGNPLSNRPVLLSAPSDWTRSGLTRFFNNYRTNIARLAGVGR